MAEKVTLGSLKQLKRDGKAISVLTCYDYATAVQLQEAGLDCLLVGDSLGQMVLGHRNTLSVTMDIMVTLAGAVRRGAPDVYLIGDMPFLSYQISAGEAIGNAGRFMAEAGCDAVKMEVDYRHVELVAAVSAAGIPVMAHIGHRPQAAQQREKMVETRAPRQAIQVVHEAEAMVRAGAVLLLLENVTTIGAEQITKSADVPVISCGSGPACDGPVMVLHDMLGLLPGARMPRFAKSYAQIGEQIRQAAVDYVKEVREGRYPDDEHSYHMAAASSSVFSLVPSTALVRC